MTRLQRTDLPTPHKIELATAAVAQEGMYGSITSLSEEFGVSRPTVYAAGETAVQVLDAHFERNPDKPGGAWVWVDDAQLQRAIIGLRAGSPTGIRPIEDQLEIVYPGVSIPSYGTIQKILVGAEEKSAQFNGNVDLSNLKEGAVDEMFSQGDPVLAGVDLDSGYLFLLSHEISRKGEDWARLLNICRGQGLDLEVVVKDAARGIAAGIDAVFPEAEQRDDCFHAHYEMGKVLRVLEQRALAAIEREIEAEEQGKPEIEQVRDQCQQAMELHDAFEQAMRDVQEAMEFVNLETGCIQTADQMQKSIEAAALKMKALPDDRCVKVGTYILNRAPGLSLYMKELSRQFDLLSEQFGRHPVLLAAIIWGLYLDLKKNRRPWSRTADEKRLLETWQQLQQMSENNKNEILAGVKHLLERRFRASSAIEGFNAALRPHLYVHKGVSQGFLELFRTFFNLRTRRWGRHKGTSAYQSLTGKRVDDWLSMLGYPPSQTIH